MRLVEAAFELAFPSNTNAACNWQSLGHVPRKSKDLVFRDHLRSGFRVSQYQCFCDLFQQNADFDICGGSGDRSALSVSFILFDA
ncbi:hypothetical protein HER21_30450 [Pseudomonas sp. BGM005]|nr:hypothetical protein [Pseudomonas sp. BG5]